MNTLPYVLSCDTPADLTAEYYSRRDIVPMPYRYTLGEKDYKDDLGKEMPHKRFFDTMAQGAGTKTWQPNADDFIALFSPYLEQGRDVLHICLSSGITGVMLSANLAKETLEERYPDRKFLVVDSLCASRGLGLFVDKLADLRDAGTDIDTLFAWANENKLKMNHWFYSTDLQYYVRGGRISKAEGWFGTLLRICPLMSMDDKGHLVPRKKCRGKKAVMQEMIKAMEQYAADGHDYNGKCYISNADCLPEATELAKTLFEKFPNMLGKPEIETIGPIIGSHTGPGTVALFFWGTERDG